MLQIQLPDELVQQLEGAGVTGSAVAEFVQQAVCEKLAADERRKRFFRLSDEMREAIAGQGLTKEQLLSDFHALPHST